MQSRPCGLLRGIIGRGLRPVKIVTHSGIDISAAELNEFGKARRSGARTLPAVHQLILTHDNLCALRHPAKVSNDKSCPSAARIVQATLCPARGNTCSGRLRPTTEPNNQAYGSEPTFSYDHLEGEQVSCCGLQCVPSPVTGRPDEGVARHCHRDPIYRPHRRSRQHVRLFCNGSRFQRD